MRLSRVEDGQRGLVADSLTLGGLWWRLHGVCTALVAVGPVGQLASYEQNHHHCRIHTPPCLFAYLVRACTRLASL